MTDLDRLIAAVESGEFPGDVTARDLGAPNAEFAILTFYEAFSGSLDAALALKEALLPGCDWCVTNAGATVYSMDDQSPFDCDNPTPARALLLATLRAYRATQETKE